jgi:acyl-coenzyme A synthetase/AMP-(fatty) acid ligase
VTAAPTALATALAADTDHVAAFGRDGSELRWQDLVSAATRVYARVHGSDAQRWLLNLDDAFELGAALLGCWAARKTTVLAPAPMLEGGAAKLAFDAVIEPMHCATQTRERVVWQRLAASTEQLPAIAPTAQLVLFTSGSTGVPKEVARQVHNVEAELAVLESQFGAELAGARISTTVSARHVYGMLFGLLWPLLSRRPFATHTLEFPEQLADGRAAGHALVTSPALLKRIGHLDGPGRWQAAFSSGGLLTRPAAADAARVLGVHPVEVLGSTETSGVAWRRQTTSDATAFAALPRVETRTGQDDLLEARSPFSGASGWLTMGDRARFVETGRFELLGRGDHLAKIEDKRVSLAEIERYLLESAWVADAAAVALDDGARQYVGVVAQLSPAGAVEIERRGRRSFNDALRSSLRARIERVALPRKFRYIDAIPVDTQGKRRGTVLAALFGRR